MADTYILNVKPTISNSDGRKMENDLNRRFKRVAEKFSGSLRGIGKGFGMAFKGALGIGAVAGVGVLGLIGSLIAAFKNPIDELNSSIDKALGKADNIATRAGQIGTTAGKFAQVQAIAESAGVQNFDMIISRFQTELEKARRGENDVLKEFVKRGKDEQGNEVLLPQDTLDTFLQVIQAIKTLQPSEQNYMISKIFGERANLQLAEFLQADIAGRRKQIFGSTTTEELDKAINSLAEQEDLQSILRQRTAYKDLIKKSGVITSERVRLQAQLEESKLQAENQRFGRYEDFARIAIAQEQNTAIIKDFTDNVAPVLRTGAESATSILTWLKTSKFGKWAGGVFK